MAYDPNQPRDAEGQWTDAGSAIRNAASDDPKYNPEGKLSVEQIKKIKPEQFYKYEYLSKSNNEWKPILKTDSPIRLHSSGYVIRIKELYRYTQ